MSRKSVTPNGEKIKKLRIDKGWTAEDMAEKAKVNLKTIRTAEFGKGVYLVTLKLIADALGVEVRTLIAFQRRRGILEITVKVNPNEFDEEQKQDLLQRLRDILPEGGVIEIVSAKPSNSTKVELEVDWDDMIPLINAIKALIGTDGFPIIAVDTEEDAIRRKYDLALRRREKKPGNFAFTETDEFEQKETKETDELKKKKKS